MYKMNGPLSWQPNRLAYLQPGFDAIKHCLMKYTLKVFSSEILQGSKIGSFGGDLAKIICCPIQQHCFQFSVSALLCRLFLCLRYPLLYFLLTDIQRSLSRQLVKVYLLLVSEAGGAAVRSWLKRSLWCTLDQPKNNQRSWKTWPKVIFTGRQQLSDGPLIVSSGRQSDCPKKQFTDLFS